MLPFSLALFFLTDGRRAAQGRRISRFLARTASVHGRLGATLAGIQQTKQTNTLSITLGHSLEHTRTLTLLYGWLDGIVRP